MANASNIDPDDVVVAELDVVFSNELAGLQSQLVMLQQPLRPNWRAYDAGAPGSSARFKPNARRLEISLPLDTESDNFREQTDEQKSIKTLELRSTQVEDPVSSYAGGVIKGSQLVLVPLDFTLQLRPNMAYLNPTAACAAGGEWVCTDDEAGVHCEGWATLRGTGVAAGCPGGAVQQAADPQGGCGQACKRAGRASH